MARFKKIVIGRYETEVMEMDHLNVRSKNMKAGGKEETKRVTTKEEKEEHYFRRQVRKAKQLRQILKINFAENQSVFVTLTFSEQPETLKKGNNCFRKMIKALKSRYNNLLYLAVIECNQEGNFHYHVIFNISYNIQFEEDIRKFWKWGIEISVENVYAIDNLGQYITKQFWEKSNKLYGCKRYLASENLQRPETAASWNESDRELMSVFEKQIANMRPSYNYTLTNEYGGDILFSGYIGDSKIFDDYVIAIRK